MGSTTLEGLRARLREEGAEVDDGAVLAAVARVMGLPLTPTPPASPEAPSAPSPSPSPPASPLAPEAPAASAAGYERLGREVPIDWIERGRPLVAQGPFPPRELAALSLAEGTATPVAVLSAPTQTGKSPALAYLSLKAMSEGAWVLLFLNLSSNAAIRSLVAKVKALFRMVGINDLVVWDDRAFTKPGRALFEDYAHALRAGRPGVWVCKADEAQIRQLLAADLGADVWRRCVVMIDEVHCFFTLAPAAGAGAGAGDGAGEARPERAVVVKQAERHLWRLLRDGADGADGDGDGEEGGGESDEGEGGEGGGASGPPRPLRVRAMVLSDATDADVPHMLHALGLDRHGYVRVRADAAVLRRRRYVSTDDFELFDGGLAEVLGARQRYGKDHLQRLPYAAPAKRAKRGARGEEAREEAQEARTYTGAEFAREVELDDFHPRLRAFFEDALLPPGAGAAAAAGGRRFLLELTSPNKSEATHNSVEHHALAVARLFPGAVALAEHGQGCVHVRADGGKTRYASHAEAHSALAPTLLAGGAPKYLISNIGYGSITYALPGAPITHVYVGFRDEANNLLVKTQGLGRATGYVAADLEACGAGAVRVLCTRRDFDAMRTGLPAMIEEMYDQYPNHVAGTYSAATFLEYGVAHARNAKAAETRRRARVAAPAAPAAQEGAAGAAGAAQEAGGASRDAAALHASVERALGDVAPFDPDQLEDKPALRLPKSLTKAKREERLRQHERALAGVRVSSCSAHEADLAALAGEGVQITTRVLQVTCTEAMMADLLRAAQADGKRPRDTDLGAVVCALQEAQGVPDVYCAWLPPDKTRRDAATSKKSNANPAHIGKRAARAAPAAPAAPAARGGAKRRSDPDRAYAYLWTPTSATSLVVVVRLVALDGLRLPFVYHRVTFDAAGAYVGVAPTLVTAPGQA